MKKCLFIFNPHTGGGRLKNKLMEILCLFADADYSLTVHPTKRVGDARQLAAQRAHKFDLVVCCGGDGTLNETVHGLMQSKRCPVLGYIPGGTTNDFASSLLLPKSDMVAAARRILAPKKIFEFDVGSFNDRVFNYVAAFGAFTDVSYTTPQTFKNLLGYFAYLLEGVQRLPNLKAFHATALTNESTIQGEFLFGMVANSTSVGGIQFKRKGAVRLDDGIFEMMLVRKPHNLSELGGLSTALLLQDFSSPWIETHRISQLEILSNVPIPWTLDGEFGGQHTDAKIKVNQKALRICI